MALIAKPEDSVTAFLAVSISFIQALNFVRSSCIAGPLRSVGAFGSSALYSTYICFAAVRRRCVILVMWEGSSVEYGVGDEEGLVAPLAIAAHDGVGWLY